MAGKYYQDKKDRRDERRGMERRHEKESMDTRYMGMISEDRSAPANLPQGVVSKEYPKTDYMDSHYLDDSIRGVDDTLKDNIKMVDSHQSDSMY